MYFVNIHLVIFVIVVSIPFILSQYCVNPPFAVETSTSRVIFFSLPGDDYFCDLKGY